MEKNLGCRSPALCVVGIYYCTLPKCHECIYCRKQFRCHIATALTHLSKSLSVKPDRIASQAGLKGEEMVEDRGTDAFNQSQ